MTARFFQPWAQERIEEFRRADAFDSAVDWEHFVSLEFGHQEAAEIAVKIALSREVDTMYVGVCRTPTERFHGEEPWKHHWSYNKMFVLNAGWDIGMAETAALQAIKDSDARHKVQNKN